MGSASTPPSLAVSIVTYAPDLGVLNQTLLSLGKALAQARAGRAVGRTVVLIVDNGPGDEWRLRLREAAERALTQSEPGDVRIISGHGNIGYGRGHNLAISGVVEDYHLVLNPDVITDQHAIREAVRFMDAHQDVGFLTPAALGPDGKVQYLCKRYPAIFDLFVRGFLPRFLKRIFRKRLDRYEMKSEMRDAPVFDIPIASGSFMFLRRSDLVKVGGFSDAFFMYFEDFDLSVRLAKISRIAYVPSVKITHLGGNAARKGWAHIRMFIRSGITFYMRHGWKWW